MKSDYILERETPTVSGWQTIGAVLVLALGSGLVVFVGVGLLALAFGWAVAVALACAGGAVIVVWLVGVLRVEGLFYVSETIKTLTNAPPPARDVVTVEVMDIERGQVRYADFPGTVDQLHELARGLLAGRSFSEADWTGRGRPFTRAEFRELRGHLLERGLLAWRNSRAPQQGVELTAVGRHVFAGVLRAPACARTGGSFALLEGGNREGVG